MTAQDDDVGLYGQFMYSMGSDGGSYFDIDEQIGLITVKDVDPSLLDRENPPDDAIIVSGGVSYHSIKE